MGYETNPSYDECLIELSRLRNSNNELRRLIQALSTAVHGGYDFNKDELKLSLWEGEALRGEA